MDNCEIYYGPDDISQSRKAIVKFIKDLAEHQTAICL